jgi:hypothetical protein
MKFWIVAILWGILAVLMLIGALVLLMAVYLTFSEEPPVEENYKLKTRYCAADKICNEVIDREYCIHGVAGGIRCTKI